MHKFNPHAFSVEQLERLDVNRRLRRFELQAREGRGFLHLPSYGIRMSGGVTALYYFGTTGGVFAGGIGESLIFSVAGSWTFFVTGPVPVTLKGCGAGGGGLGTTYETGIQNHAYAGGGGGAYHLSFSYTFVPGVIYELTIGAGASGVATLLKIQGGADILQLGAGGPPTGVNMATGGVGGTSATGGGSTGGAGGNTPAGTGGSTSGTGGGGCGGGGNLGGTGGTNGFTGGNGESSGVAGATAGAFTGGDGGYGGGITLADATTGYGRGAGGGGDEAGVSEVTPVNADKAKEGAMQFTRA